MVTKKTYMIKAREAIKRLEITDLPTIRFIYRHELGHEREINRLLSLRALKTG